MTPTKTTAIQKTEPDFFELLVPDQIKKYISSNATDREIGLFLIQAKMYELNPFKREIYLVKYSQQAPASIVVGFEAFLKRAERTNRLKGWRVWTEGNAQTKQDFKAMIEIWRADWDKPFIHEVYWDEYAARKGDGSLTRFWAEKPRTMLKKVVISQGFRLCFPDEMGGMPYCAEEINTIDVEVLPKADVQVLSKEEPIIAPKPTAETSAEPDPVVVEDEEPPLPTAEDAPLEESPVPENKELTEQRAAIVNAFLKLSELGRNIKNDIEPKLKEAMKIKFHDDFSKSRIPEDLNQEVGAWVLMKLGKTIDKELNKNGGQA